MKKFLIVIIIGFLLVTVLDQLVGRAIEKAFATATNGEQGRINHILNDVDAPILVFGSSRALHHYVPQTIVDSTGLEFYNCGFEAQGIMINYALIRNILQRYKPRLILYELDYHYDIELDKYTSNVSKVRRMTQLECRDSLLYSIDPWERLRMKSRIYPYNSALIELVLNRFRNSIYDRKDVDRGYIPQYRIIDANARDNWDLPIVTDSVKLRLFADLVDRYHDRLIFFSSPTYQVRPRLDQMYAPVRKIAAPYGVPVYEFCTDTTFVGNRELWDDLKHLNDAGAHVYTARVAHLVKLWLETHPEGK